MRIILSLIMAFLMGVYVGLTLNDYNYDDDNDFSLKNK